MNRYTPFLLGLFSITAFAQKASYETQIDELFSKAYEYLYIEKDSAYYYFNEIEDLAVKNEDWAIVFEALISSNRNAGAFYDLDQLSNNLHRLVFPTIFRSNYCCPGNIARCGNGWRPSWSFIGFL